MSDFDKLAHPLKQLGNVGNERFQTLISSDHTGKVTDAIPTSFTVGDRTYDVLGFLREGETSVVGHEMVTRAKSMSAHLGQDDGEHILKYQDQIPVSLRGKVVFVFTDWRHSEDVYVVFWGERSRQWVKFWGGLGIDWYDGDRVLRRKKSPGDE